MSTIIRPVRSSHSLRAVRSLGLGAIAFSMFASLAACATLDASQRGYASAAAAEAQPAQSGFASADPSRPAPKGYADAAQPSSSAWGYAQLPAQPSSTFQASRTAR